VGIDGRGGKRVKALELLEKRGLWDCEVISERGRRVVQNLVKGGGIKTKENIMWIRGEEKQNSWRLGGRKNKAMSKL